MKNRDCNSSRTFEESCGCPPPKGKQENKELKELKEVVKDYQKVHLKNLESFLGTFNGDIKKCVYGPIGEYKKHPHQKRLSQKVLDGAIEKIKKINNSLATTKNFHALYDLVKNINQKGFGLLATYDFAIRYGFNKGLIPEKEVYLHAGTLDGAKAVLPDIKHKAGDIIRLESFPEPLQSLNGLHLENLLCIYKKELKIIMSK